MSLILQKLFHPVNKPDILLLSTVLFQFSCRLYLAFLPYLAFAQNQKVFMLFCPHRS